jgi:hypothetical protein
MIKYLLYIQYRCESVSDKTTAIAYSLTHPFVFVFVFVFVPSWVLVHLTQKQCIFVQYYGFTSITMSA